MFRFVYAWRPGEPFDAAAIWLGSVSVMLTSVGDDPIANIATPALPLRSLPPVWTVLTLAVKAMTCRLPACRGSARGATCAGCTGLPMRSPDPSRSRPHSSASAYVTRRSA